MSFQGSQGEKITWPGAFCKTLKGCKRKTSANTRVFVYPSISAFFLSLLCFGPNCNVCEKAENTTELCKFLSSLSLRFFPQFLRKIQCNEDHLFLDLLGNISKSAIPDIKNTYSGTEALLSDYTAGPSVNCHMQKKTRTAVSEEVFNIFPTTVALRIKTMLKREKKNLSNEK